MKSKRLQGICAAVAVAGLAIYASVFMLARAADYPHDKSKKIECNSCHTKDRPKGPSNTKFKGSAELCQSCHSSTGGKPHRNSKRQHTSPVRPGTNHRGNKQEYPHELGGCEKNEACPKASPEANS